MSTREKLICAGLIVGTAGAGAVAYETARAIAEYRAGQAKTAPLIERTARNVAAITAVLSNCEEHPTSCIETTAADLQAAAGQVKEAAGQVKNAAESIPRTAGQVERAAESAAGTLNQVNQTAAELHQLVSDNAGNVGTVTAGAAQLTALLADCKANPHTCIQPRVAGTMRAVELAAGHVSKITREGERVAAPTADAIRDTSEHAATVSGAAAKVAEPVAEDLKSMADDGKKIVHRIASPITYVLNLVHQVAKKIFPFIP